MKIASFTLLMFTCISIFSQNIWDGTPITFTKENYADWTLPENQDRITDDIWITRANSKPIFNIAEEILEESPKDTRWAIGSISDGVDNLKFNSWLVAIEHTPPEMVDTNMVLYLVSDEIYIDIKFTSWTSGEGIGGGGFSYERSTGDVSETLWTGPKITFTKANYADWTLPENQDRITDNVWITRADQTGLFNIAMEDSYDRYRGFGPTILASPTDTKWAFGNISDGVENLSFDYWIIKIQQSPPEMVNTNMVLFLIKDSIYIDIKFTSWTSGEEEGGGGFSYERSTGDISETLWTGPKITFAKANHADWTIAENQDRITENVWITRADQQGIFNIANESSYLFTSSVPTNTLWAYGKTSDGIENLDFNYFIETVEFEAPTMLNSDMVLQLLPHNIYIDIKFTSWTSGEGEGGGGFSYTRSTDASSATFETTNQNNQNICYPNPASKYIHISDEIIMDGAYFRLYDTNGRKVHNEYLKGKSTVSIQHLINGLYIYKIHIMNKIYSGRIIINRN